MKVDLSVTVTGIRFTAPFIVASAGNTENVRQLKLAEKNGAAGAVMKSLFENSAARRSPTPRFKIIRYGENRTDSDYTLYSYEQASEWDEHRYAQEVETARRELKMPVIPSINCVTMKGWKTYAKAMEDAGAPAIEINISCSHDSVSTRADDVEKDTAEVIAAVRSAVRVPIWLKMTPQLTNPVRAAKLFEQAGADALVMFNRFGGMDIDPETEAPVMHRGWGGHGGKYSIHYNLRWIAAASDKISVPIIASGGAHTAGDIMKFILAGARLVQICTAFIMDGYGIIPRIRRDLESWMRRKDYSSINAISGRAARRVLGSGQIDRRQTKTARIRNEDCTLCGLCKTVCYYFTVEIIDSNYTVTAACTGCGLCAERCPVSCIDMVDK